MYRNWLRHDLEQLPAAALETELEIILAAGLSPQDYHYVSQLRSVLLERLHTEAMHVGLRYGKAYLRRFIKRYRRLRQR